MLVVLRTVLALGYIYVIGMGAYITFYGLPDFDNRTVSERRLDSTVAQARATTCGIYLSMDATVLTPTEQAKRAACVRER